MKILFAPYARALRNGFVNAKNYIHSKELAKLLVEQGHTVIQVGSLGEELTVEQIITGKDFDELSEIIQDFDTFISCDSYLQHHCWFLGKRGIVIWSVSNPDIFGHDLHINLLRDRKYVRPGFEQFSTYEGLAPNPEAFVSPAEVLDALKRL